MDILLKKIALRVDDKKTLQLIKLMLKAGEKLGVSQGGVASPLFSNIYLTEIDAMLERDKEVTRIGQYTYMLYRIRKIHRRSAGLDRQIPQVGLANSSSESAASRGICKDRT